MDLLKSIGQRFSLRRALTNFLASEYSMAFFLLLTGCRGRTCPALNFAVIALERVVYFYAAGRACPAPTEQSFGQLLQGRLYRPFSGHA